MHVPCNCFSVNSVWLPDATKFSLQNAIKQTDLCMRKWQSYRANLQPTLTLVVRVLTAWNPEVTIRTTCYISKKFRTPIQHIYVSYDSHNKYQISPWTVLTGWNCTVPETNCDFLQPGTSVISSYVCFASHNVLQNDEVIPTPTRFVCSSSDIILELLFISSVPRSLIHSLRFRFPG
jgi:hypothetical protein